MTPEREGRPSARPTSNVAMSEATIYRVRWADLTRYQAFLWSSPASVDTGSLGRFCSLGDSFVFGW